MHFIPSPEVSRGGCMVRTKFGLIDARRETRLERIRKPSPHECRNPGPGTGSARALARVRGASVVETRGRVVQLIGLVIESEGPMAAVGEVCRIESARHHDERPSPRWWAFGTTTCSSCPSARCTASIPAAKWSPPAPPCAVAVGEKPSRAGSSTASASRSTAWGPIQGRSVPLNLPPPHPAEAPAHPERLSAPASRRSTPSSPAAAGSASGIFAGSGVGKSTLLGMMASQAEADVNVIALIGERGREVREFLEKDLDEAGREIGHHRGHLQRAGAGPVEGGVPCLSMAEYFRDRGQNVLLMMDSVTRFAMAQREIGLAVGEPPATRGYTPSVFSLLPQLLERAGTGERGPSPASSPCWSRPTT
jgi:flagellum-specific ATP synthase